MSKKRNARRRTRNVLLIVSMMLVVAMASIGGTLAWLTASTTEIVNTFSPSNIGITLTETSANEFKLVPGVEYTKNPVVAVDTTKTDVDIYLFVKFDEVYSPANYLDYTSTLSTTNGWTQGDGTDIPANVWYRVVEYGATTTSWNLLDGDKVTVKSSLEKTDMPSVSAKPQLKYTAYAIQYEGFEDDPAGAWTQASSATVVSGGSN